MFNNFGFMGSKILKVAENERYKLSHPYVGSEHFTITEYHPLSTISQRVQSSHLIPLPNL